MACLISSTIVSVSVRILQSAQENSATANPADDHVGGAKIGTVRRRVN
jgi:hypothetical protein